VFLLAQEAPIFKGRAIVPKVRVLFLRSSSFTFADLPIKPALRKALALPAST
jgi:hypothetical protein